MAKIIKMGKKDNIKDLLQIKAYTDTSVDIYLYGDIVGSYDSRTDYEDMYPAYFKELIEQANGRDINLYINSGGGTVTAGLAMATMLKRYEGNTRAYIDGVCGSIATVIALACKERYIASNAFFMYHEAHIGTYVQGNAKSIVEQAQDVARVLEQANEAMIQSYTESLAEGADIEVIKANMASGKDTWLLGSEAVSFFNMQLTEANEAVAYVDSDYFDKDTMPDGLNVVIEPVAKVEEIEEVKAQDDWTLFASIY